MLILLLSLPVLAGLSLGLIALRRLWQALPSDNRAFGLEDLGGSR